MTRITFHLSWMVRHLRHWLWLLYTLEASPSFERRMPASICQWTRTYQLYVHIVVKILILYCSQSLQIICILTGKLLQQCALWLLVSRACSQRFKRNLTLVSDSHLGRAVRIIYFLPFPITWPSLRRYFRIAALNHWQNNRLISFLRKWSSGWRPWLAWRTLGQGSVLQSWIYSKILVQIYQLCTAGGAAHPSIKARNGKALLLVSWLWH